MKEDEFKEIDINNFMQMYYANCKERETYGEPILSPDEYRDVWREFVNMKKDNNGT